VTGTAEGEIRDPSAGPRLEEPEYLLEHHRDMPGRAHLNARERYSSAVSRGQAAPVGP
jgi:hypothetical protein